METRLVTLIMFRLPWDLMLLQIAKLETSPCLDTLMLMIPLGVSQRGHVRLVLSTPLLRVLASLMLKGVAFAGMPTMLVHPFIHAIPSGVSQRGGVRLVMSTPSLPSRTV